MQGRSHPANVFRLPWTPADAVRHPREREALIAARALAVSRRRRYRESRRQYEGLIQTCTGMEAQWLRQDSLLERARYRLAVSLYRRWQRHIAPHASFASAAAAAGVLRPEDGMITVESRTS